MSHIIVRTIKNDKTGTALVYMLYIWATNFLTRFLYSGLLLLYQFKATSPHANAATPAKQANVILFMVLLRPHMDFYFTAVYHKKICKTVRLLNG